MTCQILKRLVEQYGGRYVETDSYCIAYLNSDVQVIADIYYREDRGTSHKITIRRIGDENINSEAGTLHLRDIDMLEVGHYAKNALITVYRASGLARRIVLDKTSGKIIYVI